MRLIKLKSILDNKLKRYLLYAIGELCIIVLGILVALYIKNKNADNQYKKEIDNNILRVYSELDGNIDEAKETIMKIREKDSLIYLVMNDSIEPKTYYKDPKLVFLILNFYNLNIEDKAYQNLISLNVSGNIYKEELLSDLKELYSINKNIKKANQRMSNFVYDKSLPMLAENTKAFGDFSYKRQVKKDLVDFLTTSQKYESYVSQYAIIAIQNQLRQNQNFLKRAYNLRKIIKNQYNLESESNLGKDTLISDFRGAYTNKNREDTISIKFINDSILLFKNKATRLNLIPLNKNKYFTDIDLGAKFVSFIKKRDSISMKLNLLSDINNYTKIEKTSGDN